MKAGWKTTNIKKIREIVEREKSARVGHKTIAEILNKAGYTLPSGKEFNDWRVSQFVLHFCDPKLRIDSRRKSDV